MSKTKKKKPTSFGFLVVLNMYTLSRWKMVGKKTTGYMQLTNWQKKILTADDDLASDEMIDKTDCHGTKKKRKGTAQSKKLQRWKGRVMIPKTNEIELHREIELETGRARGIQAVF